MNTMQDHPAKLDVACVIDTLEASRQLIEALMPGVRHIALQDYAALNEVPGRLRRCAELLREWANERQFALYRTGSLHGVFVRMAGGAETAAMACDAIKRRGVETAGVGEIVSLSREYYGIRVR
jgi:hypothetical protein